jgi:hypothetical protein
VLHLKFKDLDLFPMICADLVQAKTDGALTAQGRLEKLIGDAGPSQRPVLVVGSLYQSEPSNVNWPVAIDAWLNQVTSGRAALVAIANVAIDRPISDEARDCWRSLSGVLVRRIDRPHNQRDLPVARGVTGQDLRGAMLRHTKPYVASGTLTWRPYGPTGDLFYWHASMGAALTPDGVAAPLEDPPSTLACEVLRFVRRTEPHAAWGPRVQSGLLELRRHLEADSVPNAVCIATTLLDGVSVPAERDPDKLHEAPLQPALRDGLHALATLSSVDNLLWQKEPSQVGQLRCADINVNVLVWRDPQRSGPAMKHALGAWAKTPGEHPPLVVFGQGPLTSPREGVISVHPRDDIEAAPESQADLGLGGSLGIQDTDITEPQARRSVACLHLERLHSLYADHVPGEGAEADQNRIADLKAKLVAVFEVVA